VIIKNWKQSSNQQEEYMTSSIDVKHNTREKGASLRQK